MDIPSSLAIISLAALIHASFQLSVSVLTLLSGHSIGSRHSHARLMRLTTGFVFGTGVMTMLLLSFASLMFLSIFGGNTPPNVWAAACGLMVGVAVSIWLFYYRRGKGTTLWIPRVMADFLTNRTKATKISAESFSLGLASVMGEILFIAAPIIVSALVLIQLPALWQLAGIVIYTLVSMLSLIIVWILVGNGYKLSKIQKWRESNKYFLQFIAGGGLIVLTFFVYVYEILGTGIGLK